MSDVTEVPPRPAWVKPKPTRPPVPQPAASVEPRAAVPPPAEKSWATLWLTDRDITVFAALAAVVLVMLVIRWGQLSGWGMHEVNIERLQPLELTYRLDLNTATWVEFAQLDGVGEALALRIVEHREKYGPYRTVDDLDVVEGIGPKTLERLRPYLRVADAERPAQ